MNTLQQTKTHTWAECLSLLRQLSRLAQTSLETKKGTAYDHSELPSKEVPEILYESYGYGKYPKLTLRKSGVGRQTRWVFHYNYDDVSIDGYTGVERPVVRTESVKDPSCAHEEITKHLLVIQKECAKERARKEVYNNRDRFKECRWLLGIIRKHVSPTAKNINFMGLAEDVHDAPTSLQIEWTVGGLQHQVEVELGDHSYSKQTAAFEEILNGPGGRAAVWGLLKK